jgi:hypothetical protein
MNREKFIEYILRVSVFGEFLGHGILALQGKSQWVGWIQDLLLVTPEGAKQILLLIGVADVIVSLLILFRPIRIVLVWAALWGFWTALLRPIVGEPIWDFVERWANWGAPLALLLMKSVPKDWKGWLK